MILIKLGGSIITNKEKPLSPRMVAINKIAVQLRKIKEPLVLVHGGGSFGHYWSVKYDMHTKPARYNVRGVSIVKNSMVELDRIILEIFEKNKINTYCLPPTDFMKGDKPIPSKINEIEKIAKSGLVPITYGDALWYGDGKSYILSGDRIMSILAKALRPRLCIFVLNVDGLYSDLKTHRLIRNIGEESFSFEDVKMDVTGGMKRKVEEASKIAKMGLKAFFVNGNMPERIVSAIQKNKFNGTLFGGK